MSLNFFGGYFWVLGMGVWCGSLAAAPTAVPPVPAEGTPLPSLLAGADPEAQVDQRLRPNLRFWIDIYSKYGTRQTLIHDGKYIDRIYEIVDQAAGGRNPHAAKEHWHRVLLSLHAKTRGTPPESRERPPGLTAEERRVFEMFADIREPDKFLRAANRRRLRVQKGQRDAFLAGLKESGRYLPAMEEIFRQQGMPVELTRLPFVESSFNTRARSKVGASGIWQFMRSTGALFLTVNASLDERNDPLKATEAAAKLLRMNYESLQSWPLAVTAYNHGRKGMMRAVRRVGSDELGDVVSAYRGKAFGFASSNFFTGLLAAIEVERHADRYFGPVARERPLSYFEARLPSPIGYRELVRFMKLDTAELRALNLGLQDGVLQGYDPIPAGYVLRLPGRSDLDKASQARVFLAAYAQIPGVMRGLAQREAKTEN